jgi:hypothetical protein
MDRDAIVVYRLAIRLAPGEYLDSVPAIDQCARTPIEISRQPASWPHAFGGELGG